MIRLASSLFILLSLSAACSTGPDRPAPDAGVPTDTGAGTDTGSDPGDAGDAGDAGDTGDLGDTGTTTDAGFPRGPWGALSLNLHCLDTDGTAFATNEARFAAIADRAVSGGARVLLLQEACDDGTVSALDALEGALEAASGREWHGSFAFAHVAWEGTPQEADEGVAILADVTLNDTRVLEHGALGSLRRVMLSAALGGDLTGLRVGAFHLDHADEAVRRLQARELAVAGLVHGDSANVLLGGDLNDREGSAAYAALGEAGYLDTSSALRSTRIDHLFLHRGAGMVATSAELVFDGTGERVSDHPGVLIQFGAATGAPVELTTFDLEVDAGAGNGLFVRGDQAPLSWTEGWPAINAGPSLWRFLSTELSGAFEYKVLRNDADWSVGENYRGTAGVANRATTTAFE